MPKSSVNQAAKTTRKIKSMPFGVLVESDHAYQERMKRLAESEEILRSSGVPGIGLLNAHLLGDIHDAIARKLEPPIVFGRVLTCNPSCRRDRHHFGPCLSFRLEDLETQPSGSPPKPSGSMLRMLEERRVPLPEGWVWKGWAIQHTALPDGDKSKPCELPPDGWSCTRGKGHYGPCAASPVELGWRVTTLAEDGFIE